MSDVFTEGLTRARHTHGQSNENNNTRFGICTFGLYGTRVFGANNQQWVYPPFKINMNGNTPVVTTMPGATAGASNISNGAYDANGNLLFYVKDLHVYTSTSVLKGKLPNPGPGGTGNTWSWLGAEVEIIPVPGSGFCKFYVIYTVRDQTSNHFCLVYATIDLSSGSPVSIPAYGSTLTASHPSWSNVLQWLYYDGQGLAVSKPILNNTKRYLFTVGFKGSPNLAIRNANNFGGILRWTIDAAGVHSQTVIAADTSDLGSYYSNLTYLTVAQMSLSDDQTRLAWGGGTQGFGQQQSVFEIKLNPATYSFVPTSFRQYYLPMSPASFVAGVEYAAGSNKLYASTRGGIYYIASYGSSPVLIPGSPSLTHQPLSAMNGSHLQYWKSTGKIVGVQVTNTSANTGTLFSIDPSSNSTASISSTALKSRIFVFTYDQGFTLPEQVDVITPGCAALITPDFTYQAYYASPNNYFTVTATPVPSSAPCGLGDVWIIEQLDSTGNPIPGTNTSTGSPGNPNCWWNYPAANIFSGFDGTKTSGVNNVTCGTPSPGKFLNGGTYRITRGVWNSHCPWSQTSHTITVTGNKVTGKFTAVERKANGNVPDFRHLKPRGR